MATRESTYKPSSHCAGKAGVFPLNLYARVQHSLMHLRTRDRGCSAHPVFPAPSLEGRVRPLFEDANEIVRPRANHVARMRTHISSSLRTQGPIRRVVSVGQRDSCRAM